MPSLSPSDAARVLAAVVLRRAARRPTSPLHAVADAAVPGLAQVFRAGFRAAQRALTGPDRVPAALRALRTVLDARVPTQLRTIYVGGGVVGAELVTATLRTATFNPDQPRDEQGRWTDAGREPYTQTRAEFYATNTLVKRGVSSYAEGLRLSALPDETPLWVFHATDVATAKQFAEQGIDPTEKPSNLARSQYERGEYAEFAPGRGLAPGLTVGSTPQDVSGYGRQLLAIRVTKGDLKVPPEQAILGVKTGGMALGSNDAYVDRKISASNIRLIGEQGRYPSDAHEEFIKQALREGKRVPLNVLKDYPNLRGLEDFRTAKRTPLKTKIEFTFDRKTDAAIDWADRHAAELIDGISETSREAINNAVAEFLETGEWNEYRDEILAAVGDDVRADLIARNESMIAVHEGQREAWNQAVDEGLLTGDEQREWIIVGDDKVCPICQALEGTRAGIGEPYVSDGEEYDGPPAHVSCRCSEGIV